MELIVKRKNVKPTVTGSMTEIYSHDLQMYKIPPLNTITLKEFEELALERVKVLRILSSVTTLKGFKLYTDEWNAAVIAELKSEGLKCYSKLCRASGNGTSESDLQARRRDHISHFILRLAYCRSEELRRWFISRELELFKMRFLALSSEGVTSFFKVNSLQYVPISGKEKSDLMDDLYLCTMPLSHGQIENLNFYKVRFFEVNELVKNRRVFVQNGFAYIPSTEFISVLLTQLRAQLNESLARANRKLPVVEQDDRIVQLLKGLHHSYSGQDYSNTVRSSLPIESLDSLSTKSFPFCMRQLHEHLRSAHHMKHGGRIQYGLFLKGIGVTLEDSLRFWREEFTKLMDLDKFEKQYAYNIRYNYGKEGSRKNYTPFSCMKIIQGAVGPGDTHGCPFKHSDADILKNKLLGYGVSPEGISSIVDLVKKNHYQVACSKYFDIMHNAQLEIGINHPNQYFEESQNLISGNTKKPLGKVQEEAAQNEDRNSKVNDDFEWNDDFDYQVLNNENIVNNIAS